MRTVAIAALAALYVALGIVSAAPAQDIAQLAFDSPTPYMVVQRRGFVPHRAGANEPGGPVLGFADIALAGKYSGPADGIGAEFRAVPLQNALGSGVDWSPLEVHIEGGAFQASARTPAGGWYRLELRFHRGGKIVAEGAIEPLGVGEVFVIAGQSYASNSNDERLAVSSRGRAVATRDWESNTWRIADDPQPTPDRSDGGSIWPAVGDLLAPQTRTPIGFANVVVGGTSTAQWAPGGDLHRRLVDAGSRLGRFRAVLWQQGESDVIAKTTTADYVNNVRQIREAAAKAWKFEPIWLLARSTLHPTVYNDPAGESRIRRGIDELCRLPGFRLGPDTDALAGENRGGPTSRRHFSAIGQRRAAELWFASIWNELQRPRPDHEAVLQSLPALHLRESAWRSAVVHRESSVLIRQTPEGPAVARLAFPAARIISAASADGGQHFDVASDLELSADGKTLTFQRADPIAPIDERDFFPPANSPNSYSHRVGHPDQFVLYRPGIWFHQRDVEITYARRDAPAPATALAGSLPKTLARLRSGEPIAIGVSGDSISTGLDASAMSFAAPMQPGWPDLVAAQLTEDFGADVTLHNRAVAGWSITNGLADLDKLLESKPNLLIVAYGMNDVGRRDPGWFGEQAKTLVERVRKFDPEIEIILVASMLGNAQWVHTPRDMFGPYRDKLVELAGDGVTVADVTEVWRLLLENKHDLDLTGNGLNHPNDFGHRLYAQAILEHLPCRP